MTYLTRQCGPGGRVVGMQALDVHGVWCMAARARCQQSWGRLIFFFFFFPIKGVYSI